MIRKCSHRGDTYKTCFWKMSKGEKTICLKSRLIPFSSFKYHIVALPAHHHNTQSSKDCCFRTLDILCASKGPFSCGIYRPLSGNRAFLHFFTFWENCMLRFEFLSDSVLYCMCDVFNISEIFHIKHISDEIVLYLATKGTCN